MPLKLSSRNALYLATGVLYLCTVAQGAETAVTISNSLLSQPSQFPLPPSSFIYPVQSGATTLVTSVTSTTTVTSTISASPSQPHDKPFGFEPDRGYEYGNVTIRNHCNETLFLKSVGAHRLNGPRNDTVGWGIPEEEVAFPLVPGGNYSEPFRTTCPLPINGTAGYCWTQDKLAGQGVALKISKNNFTSSDVTQVEYALVQNPITADAFQRLNYDISLLDCANPAVYPAIFNVKTPGMANAAGARDLLAITDVAATQADHDIKVVMCPGYRDGVSVSFPSDVKEEKCPAIRCEGVTKCPGIYTFDRTRAGEPSKACQKEYKGDMVVDLCAARMNATVKAV